MRLFRSAFSALSLATLAAGFGATAPAQAAVSQADPGQFIESLTNEGFAILRSGNRQAARTKFRQILSQHFAVDTMGERLIRRWRGQITPAQLAAYKQALPGFLIGTYSDRLFDYANTDVKVVRFTPRGTGAAVLSQVVRPNGQRPLQAIWTVDRAGGRYQVTNLTVAGINVALTQEADFNAYIQRNGFDKLVAFMRSRAA